MGRNKFLLLVISLILPFVAGGIGSAFTISAIASWYATLTKPAFNPPSWIFAPVWNALYLMMGISLYLVWSSRENKKNKEAKTLGLRFFFIQLTLNAAWSIVFFGMRSPALGLIVIALLWISILKSVLYFKKVSVTAFLLLVPYILWVSFAAVLNFFILYLNR